MHRYWLQVAINLCGSRKELARRIGVKRGRITAWLNHTKGISLENAIKIEKAVEGRVHRLQLVPYLDRKIKQQLQSEKQMNPPRTLEDKIALGLACEKALGNRKGTQNLFHLVKIFTRWKRFWGNSVYPTMSIQGRT